jgi:hypothetical protein
MTSLMPSPKARAASKLAVNPFGIMTLYTPLFLDLGVTHPRTSSYAAAVRSTSIIRFVRCFVRLKVNRRPEVAKVKVFAEQV